MAIPERERSHRSRQAAPQWNPSEYLWNIVDHVRVFVAAGDVGQLHGASVTPKEREALIENFAERYR